MNPINYDAIAIANGFNQTAPTNAGEQVSPEISLEQHARYIKVLEELLPETNDWILFKWMEHIKKLDKKYEGISASYTNFENKPLNLTPAGKLVKILLDEHEKNSKLFDKINNKANKKGQNFTEVYNKLLTIPQIVEQLDVFIKEYNFEDKELLPSSIEQINNIEQQFNLVNL